jgi:hypothetical protein
LAKTGKLSKTARASTHFGTGNQAVQGIDNDSSRGKVFVEVKKILGEASIGFQNLSSSHPIIVNKGSFGEAVELIKGALVSGEKARYSIEKEEAGTIILLEQAPKDPSRMVIRESPFSWHKAG